MNIKLLTSMPGLRKIKRPAAFIANSLNLVLIFLSLDVSAQLSSDSTPNWIARQLDFEDRRSSENPANFSASYYHAYKELSGLHSASKTGDEWTPLGPFGYEPLAGMGRVNSMQFHPTDSNTWFICVAQGGLWKTVNAGQSWISLSSDLPILRTSCLAIDPLHPDTMYLATGDYAYLGHNLQANEHKRNSHYGLGIYKTTDGGLSWNPTGLSFEQTDFEGSLIAKIFINHSNSEQLIAVGQTGAYYSGDGGDNWTQSSDLLFWDLERDPSSDSILYASTGYVHAYKMGSAGILKSSNFGQSWSQSSTSIPATDSIQRIELAVAPSSPNLIYAIACDTLGGFYAFYRSTDKGESFQQRLIHHAYPVNILNHSMDDNEGGQGRYDLAICVDLNDPDKLLIGGINIWETTDAGLNWEPVTYWALNYQGLSLHADIHEIVQNSADGSYFVSHDGGISKTKDIVSNRITEIRDSSIASTEWIHYTQGLNITSFYRLSVNQLGGSEFMAGAQDNSTVYGDQTGFYNVSGGDGMECLFNDEYYYRFSSSQNGRIYVYFTIGGTFNYDGSIQAPFGEIGEWTTPFTHSTDLLYVGYGNLYSYEGTIMSQQLSSFGNAPSKSFPAPITALAVEKSEAQYIYIAKRGYLSEGTYSEVWMTSNAGSWTNISQGLPTDQYPSYLEINQNNPEEVWITFSGFNDGKKVYHSSDGGQEWTNISFDLPNIPVNCITYDQDEDGYVYIGTDIGVFYLDTSENSWIFYSDGLPPVIVSELEINTYSNKLTAATFGRGLWEIGLLKLIPDSSVAVHNLHAGVSPNSYPNPVSDFLHVDLGSNADKINGLRVINICGVEQALDISLPLTSHYSLDVNTLLPGEYFIIFEMNGSRMVSRFTKI